MTIKQVAAYSEDNPHDDSIKAIWNDLNQRIFELIHSNLSHEKRGAIAAIGEHAHRLE